MSSALSVKEAIAAQTKAAFATSFNKADPVPGQPSNAVPEPVVAQETVPTPVSAPAPVDHVAKLSAENAALKAQVEEIQKSLKAAAGIKEEAKPRVTAKSVEQQVIDLQAQLDAMRGETSAKEHARLVEQQLPSIPEYATMKHIPDLVSQVVAEQQALREAARERGEGATEVSAAVALKALKDRRVAEAKALLGNEDFLREVGLTASSQQSRASVSRAVTSDVLSQGSIKQTVAKDIKSLVSDQLKSAMSALRP